MSSSDCIELAGAALGVSEAANESLKTPNIRATLMVIISAVLAYFIALDVLAVMRIIILSDTQATKYIWRIS